LGFRQKKDTYFLHGGVSPFVLTTQIIGEKKWLPCVVDARQTKLMEIFVTHWGLNKRMSASDWLSENS